MLHLLEAISMTTPVSFRPICYICNKPVKPQFGNGVDELGSCCSWGGVISGRLWRSQSLSPRSQNRSERSYRAKVNSICGDDLLNSRANFCLKSSMFSQSFLMVTAVVIWSWTFSLPNFFSHCW
jgi:hypothetical protein